VKRFILVLIALPLLIVLVMVIGRIRWKFSAPSPSDQPATAAEMVQSNVSATVISSPAIVPTTNAAPLLGETILRDYANTNFPPENDLTLMSRLMENSLLLLKSAANRPLSANEDWADLFRGKNGAREEYLPATHIALNAQGQLIDRWRSPLFFHALGGGRYEIRSAGPDKKLWTEDDLHRGYDGQFLRRR
jgi:Na+-transporting methylmalonyl-CoA/oxaloacetate decarboxylase gamma subunit